MAITRRDCGKGLLGFTAWAHAPAKLGAQKGPIPPDGAGKGFRHLSYSDIGGRPDSVQVMLNRRHLYVGHMFSNGVTILDASDPRKLKPVGFFSGGDFTRTDHLQVFGDVLLPLRWHRHGLRLFWRWKSRPVGRPQIPKDLRKLI